MLCCVVSNAIWSGSYRKTKSAYASAAGAGAADSAALAKSASFSCWALMNASLNKLASVELLARIQIANKE